MATQSTATYALDVALGAGDLFVEKARGVAGSLRSLEPKPFRSGFRKQMLRMYDDLARRGETLRRGMLKSGPAKRAAAQTKAARSQVKAAATSVRRAVGETAGAAKKAVTTTGKKGATTTAKKAG